MAGEDDGCKSFPLADEARFPSFNTSQILSCLMCWHTDGVRFNRQILEVDTKSEKTKPGKALSATLQWIFQKLSCFLNETKWKKQSETARVEHRRRCGSWRSHVEKLLSFTFFFMLSPLTCTSTIDSSAASALIEWFCLSKVTFFRSLISSFEGRLVQVGDDDAKWWLSHHFRNWVKWLTAPLAISILKRSPPLVHCLFDVLAFFNGTTRRRRSRAYRSHYATWRWQAAHNDVNKRSLIKSTNW